MNAERRVNENMLNRSRVVVEFNENQKIIENFLIKIERFLKVQKFNFTLDKLVLNYLKPLEKLIWDHEILM